MNLPLAENVIVAGADNRPHMLNKTQYSLWASRMLLVDSVLNGPFKYGTVTEPRTLTTPTIIKDRRYDGVTNAKTICEAYDMKATNIVLLGFPQDIYNLVNHHDKAKYIWDRVKLLIEGLKLLLHERESKLYDEFDTFTSEPEEIIHSYYLRNSTWFKEKAMLAEALELGVVLNEEQMSFLADNRDTVVTGQASQKIPTLTAFQTNDLDEFNSNSDKAPSASAVLIAKLSSYDLEVLSEEVDKENKIVIEPLTAGLERYKEQIKLFKERQKFDLNDREKYIDSQLRKEKEDKYLEEIIELENKKKALDNVVYKMGLFKELTVMKEVFNQMKTEVAKCFVDRKYFEIEKKELIIENDHLLEHIICQDVMSGVMHANVESNNVLPANNNMLEYDNLEAELLKKGNDGLLKLIISQDLVHTAVNTLATIANHQNM
uniref:Retrovirus-related Pol polyprotein from transposon TNT 1-94 n=1 Tax=Tanacetum cinerariifolium TaxID=118510 RepID=A0A699GUN8_TANCI|nr:hypothetical protein [Tanacetum cinerariifolium]